MVAKSQDDERPQESKEDVEKMVKVSDMIAGNAWHIDKEVDRV